MCVIGKHVVLLLYMGGNPDIRFLVRKLKGASCLLYSPDLHCNDCVLSL